VETENPIACATVNCDWCKTEIELYCLCVSVSVSGCVTQLLIYPIILNRTRLISDQHVTFFVSITHSTYLTSKSHTRYFPASSNINHVHCGHGLSFSMLRLRYNLTNNIFQKKNFQHVTSVFVIEPRNAWDSNPRFQRSNEQKHIMS
jgi:hypothetical protein